MISKDFSNNERGMTLVEILAVIVIISLIITVVAKNVIGQSDAAKAKLNQTKMLKLKQALGQYQLEFNSYPTSLNDLVKESADVKKSGKLFIAMAEEDDLADIWGFPYEYKTENNNRSFSFKSYGSDGVPGGEGAKSDVTMTP